MKVDGHDVFRSVRPFIPKLLEQLALDENVMSFFVEFLALDEHMLSFSVL